MSAYKHLNRQDVFVTDYQAKKNWLATGSYLDTFGLSTLKAYKEQVYPKKYPHDLEEGRHVTLTYRSISHLYYTGSHTEVLGAGTFSGSRDWNQQTTLSMSGSRFLKNHAAVISLPKDVFGTHIVRNSFILQPNPDLVQEDGISLEDYVIDNYAADVILGVNEYVEQFDTLYGSSGFDIVTEDYLVSESFYVTESIEGDPGQFMDIDQNQQRIEIVDDGYGRLVISGSDSYYSRPLRVVGDIIYSHGMAIVTDEEVANYYHTYANSGSLLVKWKSNLPIYTYNVHCQVKSSEMNHTFNPSVTTGSFGQLADNVSGSHFNPYITTLGLYNDANELIATGKVSTPVLKSPDVDMTFAVKLDI